MSLSAMCPTFPRRGIIFKDITPILKDGDLFRASIRSLLGQCRDQKIDKIVGIDARGFLFGSAVAYALNIGFVSLARRDGYPTRQKAPPTRSNTGEAEMELHIDAIESGERIV